MKKLLLFLSGIIILQLIPISKFEIEDYHTKKITVMVQGEVKEAKQLTLDVYSPLQDVLDEIEVTENADLSQLNPLMILKDQDVIVIPQKTTIVKISINHASKEELMMIKGIGEKKADDIIAYRIEHGYFQTLEDLMNIPGIKQKTFDQLKDSICL
ncbi:MAG: ComEA family DNA-binding protein [Erysipelotrichaceae bacterium]|nr:ComEA family DNA-binding protein [Erysipelotrichaceae bacterium]